MKRYKMECIIKSSKLDEVREALIRFGVSGLTISAVQGIGAHRGHTECYRGTRYNTDLHPETKLELFVPEDQLEDVEEVVLAAAQTGTAGDGNIIVTPIESVIHIRTGERDGAI